ncbi:MAG TPA: signal recognition particle-docking protein FtsY [Candidatus Babeliales bacterium]|nr:signal recognition particle-docking protein FtsY [Candidatus Babeliales bacterium]
MFNYLKSSLEKIYTTFTQKVHALFGRATIDQETLNELKTLLIGADTGIQTTNAIISTLENDVAKGLIKKGEDLKAALEKQLVQHLTTHTSAENSSVYLLVGINGSGKTTFAGKLANHFQTQGKRVLLVAGDTFRAAATQQLDQWAQRTNADIIIGKPNQEPASVVFTGCETFKNKHYDILIIDTAGRLQTKTNLMRELKKIKSIITNQLPTHTVATLLTIDAMLGQNSFDQAKLFHESTDLSGIVLTKMDGTGKGGIVFSITQELQIPIAFISFGEQLNQIEQFDPQKYVAQILQ